MNEGFLEGFEKTAGLGNFIKRVGGAAKSAIKKINPAKAGKPPSISGGLRRIKYNKSGDLAKKISLGVKNPKVKKVQGIFNK